MDPQDPAALFIQSFLMVQVSSPTSYCSLGVSLMITIVQRTARFSIHQQHVLARLARTTTDSSRLRRTNGAARCPERSYSGWAPRRR